MQEYTIDVGKIEELQTINNTGELDIIFNRAKSTIVNGEKVILIRKLSDGTAAKFDELTTLADLESHKKNVYKYLTL